MWPSKPGSLAHTRGTGLVNSRVCHLLDRGLGLCEIVLRTARQQQFHHDLRASRAIETPLSKRPQHETSSRVVAVGDLDGSVRPLQGSR
jgi:hypothetical protein